MLTNRTFNAIIFILFLTSTLFAQNKRDLVQFSGVVVAGDSLEALPFVNIIVKGTRHGTVSDYYGYFSFVAQESDTIEFSAVGYRKGHFIIPDSLSTNKYSLIHMLQKDTILLKETVIYPWPSKEQFKEAFMNLQIPDDNMDRARANLERAELIERYDDMSADGASGYRYYNNQRYNKLYYAGQYPPNNLLNPIAWSQFIKSWKKGEFKKKESKYNKKY